MNGEELERMISEWPEAEKHLARELNRSDKQWQAWQAIGEHLMKMPSDPAAWLDNIEARLPAALEHLPPEVAEEFRSLISGQLRICRAELSRGGELAVHFAVLKENVDRFRFNTAAARLNAAQEHRRAGGVTAGELKQQEAQGRIERARVIWESLSLPERNRAAIVASRMGVPADTVRRWRRDGWQLTRKADTS
ncbi:hypothetical protein HOP61_03055 [Halomonas daqingensis]|uniref:Uncharacterized protein n=1 Tax=Billgrantia desiderata TaxID=52021 RepID=A0AAW4YNX3_9GAMM|nr:hypothetical protein [Halomonas desiderata]MCE8050271.1 hypothetical protein [Halomonas desiderata]